MHPWILLALAIVLEVVGTTFLKLSDGLTRPFYVVGMGVFYTLSFVALGQAVRWVEIGIAYAVWAGLGTALIALIGVIFFREEVSGFKMVSLALVIAGVVGLGWAEPE